VLVFDAIYGSDGRDDTVVDAPFDWNGVAPSLASLRIGYLEREFANASNVNNPTEAQQTTAARRQAMYRDALDVFRAAGAKLEPIAMPDFPAGAIGFILSAEAAAAFDDLTRDREKLATLTGQSPGDWPNTFRSSRFIPAVEYLRAMRARRLLMQKMDELMSRYDVFLSLAPGTSSLQVTNLTGHPAIALKCGFVDNMPQSIMVTGRLYDEATICRVALAYEQATTWHTRHPVLAS
jgi:Asp-tRNA(Asn)/Glu-tRNA(Gln) amidotransferase A subunit family amidase